MTMLDRIKERFNTDPKFVTKDDLQLAMECLAFCMCHMFDHGHVARTVWLNDDLFQQYLALYPESTDNPTFFGIPVKANKCA